MSSRGISVFGFYGDVTFTLVTITLLLFYWYFTNTFNHWRDKGVFYLQPTFLFGTIKDRILLRLSYHEYQLQTYKKFEGHLYGGVFEGRRPLLYIRDPELIKNVMVRDFDSFVDRPAPNFLEKAPVANSLLRLKGERWKAVRTLMTPTFSSGKIKAMEDLVKECGKQMGGFLREYIKKNNSKELEVKTFYGRFTLEVIASCAFGVHGDSLKDEDSEFPRIAAKFADIGKIQRFMIFAVILLVPKLQHWIPLKTLNEDTVNFLTELVQETKKQRETNQSQRRNDFIQLMLDTAAKEEASGNGNKVLDEGTMIAQSILFLIAGFETSSTLLTFASYELALNPEIQTKLRNEIVNVLGKHGGECSYEALQEMQYLDQVLSETLRKHPPVSKVDRVCTKRYTVPGTDVTVEKNNLVTIPIAGLHHDPQYYPHPEKFDPERFTAEEKSKRPQYVYLPFGSGPRNCIGKRFALMSSKIAMTYLLKEFELQPCSKTEIPFKYGKSTFLLEAENGIWLNVSPLSGQ